MRKSLVSTALLAILLASCSTDPTITSPVAQVSLDATKAQTAQTQFLTSLRNDECIYDRINTISSEGASHINILESCKTPDMNDARFKDRKAFMNGIVLYTQALARLGGVSTDQFDADTKFAATQFSAAAKAGGFLSAFSPQFGGAGSAITAFGQLMDWIVQYYRNQEVTRMAQAQQANLNTVLQALKQENTIIAHLAFDRAQNTALAVRQIRSNPESVAETVQYVELYEIFWGSPTTTFGDIPSMNMQYPSEVTANDALDQLQFCHDLVAAGGRLEDNKCKLDPATLKSSQ